MIARIAVLPLLFVFSMAASAAPAEGDSVLNKRAGEAVKVMRGELKPDAVFNDHFLANVPPAQIMALAKQLQSANGALVAAEDIQPESAGVATFRLRFKRAVATGYLLLEAKAPFRISGFHIDAVVPLGDGPAAILRDFAALPGRSGFAVARLGDGAPLPVLAANADEQFAIGSAFKLWVLDALAEEVAAGRRRWDDVVPLGPSSLPGGITQDWPARAPVTLETLATLMISISDNTATDTLIGVIGRERIAARVRAAGHADPARTLPVLTTAEAFALKLGPASRREAFAKADEAGQLRLLEGIDPPKELETAVLTGLDGTPVAIGSIEWFASPGDIVRLLNALRRREDPRVLEILGVAPGLSKAQRAAFAYAGYKGGSESGVLNVTWLLRDKAGAWFAVTASWNDPAREIDRKRFEALAPRLIELVRQGS